MALSILSRYEIDNTIEIFQNDQEFQQVVVTDGGITLTYSQYKELTETLLEEKSHISDYTITQLNNENPPFLREEIATIYGKPYIEQNIYWQTMYTFKYSTIKIFFRSNYIKFLPDYDYLNIESSEKLKLFQEAFMREYDRFAKIIDEMYNIVDIDKVPEEYLNYLAQAIGYEREDSNLLDNSSFRELIKNIIEIYKIKGTNYSFELFFNFLGFEATLKEYWFDKRFGDPNVNSNPETGVADKKNVSFYFSSTKPTEYIPEGMRHPYIVTHDQLIGTQDANEFTRLAVNGFYTYDQLLGNTPGYPDTKYTFFKTNVMQYSLTNIQTGETEEQELSVEDLATIRRYADFLTPLFIQKNIVILIKPFEDWGSELILSDDDRHDPLSNNPTSHLDETMFHEYEGYQPTKYYWDDGTRLYGQLEDRRADGEKRYDPPTYEYWENKGSPNIRYRKATNVAPGGHFISGYHLDTYEKIWDRTPGCGSIYDQISIANPYWDSETILAYISSLLHSGTFFSTYTHARERDLIPPMIDDDFWYPYVTFTKTDDFEPGTPLPLGANFSFARGDKRRLSEAFCRTRNNKVKIRSIDVDNGSGKAEIITGDYNKRYAYLTNSDFISIFGLKHPDNEGNYQIESVSHSSGDTTITLTTTLSGRDQNYEAGFVQLYYEEWLLKNFRFPFLFDRVLEFDLVYLPWIIEESEMVWFDSLIMDEEHLLRTYAALNAGEPFPFNIPGQNYTNYPEGVERPLDPELFPFSYIDMYTGMEADLEREPESSRMYQTWNFFKFAEKNLKLRGLYTVPSGMRSSYKFLIEEPYFFFDYLDMEKV